MSAPEQGPAEFLRKITSFLSQKSNVLPKQELGGQAVRGIERLNRVIDYIPQVIGQVNLVHQASQLPLAPTLMYGGGTFEYTRDTLLVAMEEPVIIAVSSSDEAREFSHRAVIAGLLPENIDTQRTPFTMELQFYGDNHDHLLIAIKTSTNAVIHASAAMNRPAWPDVREDVEERCGKGELFSANFKRTKDIHQPWIADSFLGVSGEMKISDAVKINLGQRIASRLQRSFAVRPGLNLLTPPNLL